MDEAGTTKAVRAVILGWARALAEGDSQTLIDQFDGEYKSLSYQAEEFELPLLGIGEVDFYYRRITEIVVGVADVEVHRLDVQVHENFAWAYLNATLTLKLRDEGEPVIDDRGLARQTFVLRRSPAGWKIIHYHESRTSEHLRSLTQAAFPRAADLHAVRQEKS